MSVYQNHLCCEEDCGKSRRVSGGVPKMRAAMHFALGALLVCNLAWTEAATTGTFRTKTHAHTHYLPLFSKFRLSKGPLA